MNSYPKWQEISNALKINVNITFCSNQNIFFPQKQVKSFGQCVDSREKVETVHGDLNVLSCMKLCI